MVSIERLSLVLMLIITAKFSTSFRFAKIPSRVLPRRSLSIESSINGAEAHVTNKRFWTKRIGYTTSVVDSLDVAINVVDDMLRSCTHSTDSPELKSLATGSAEQGLVIIPRFSFMVPIHGGRLQVQHGTELPMVERIVDVTVTSPKNADALELIFSGFASRATHVTVQSEEVQRPVNETRLKALDHALEVVGLGVTGQELLSVEYAGSVPSRVYRSFVCPRARAEARHTSIESIESEAMQKAWQIALALRQLRADRASYLRNIDKPKTTGAPAATDSTSRTSSHSEDAVDIDAVVVSQKVPTIHPIALVLDNVRSANNVGSIFRSAETAGAAEVITCGITAHPPHPKLLKTAMQSVEVVPTRHFDDSLKALETLKSEGYTIVAMETTSLSKKYTDVKFTGKVALVLGHEITGVDTRIMEMADMVVEIPTYGVKNSLNVASAASIVLFEVLRQWHEKDGQV